MTRTSLIAFTVLLGIGSLARPIAFAAPDVIAEGSFRIAADASQRLTLTANKASLNEILSQLSRELDIKVTSSLPDDARITTDFRDRPLRDALRQLASSYVLVTDEVEGRVTEIFVLPEGDGSYEPSSPSPRPENGTLQDREDSPFQFEFDPSAAPADGDDGRREEVPPD